MTLSLIASHITKEYQGNQILRDCSFSFNEEAIYALIGPNGCGKSTFLRICALIEKPDSGEITYSSHGNTLQNDLSLRRRITLVLPKVGVFNTTVFNNAAYGLKVRGASKREIGEKVNSCLESFGLIGKKSQNALTLSSGETQRLGIARAMVTDPDILFLDEPTASVDLRNTEMIEETILSMKKKGRPTVVMTTHDRAQAERLADTMITIQACSMVSHKNPSRI